MTNTYYYSKELQAVITVENYTKKEMYEFLDNYIAQGCYDEESYGLLYKDGTIVIIDENNPVKKYAKRGLVAIVQNNECTFAQWGDSYELDENGAVTISNEGMIIAENAYEVDNEYYTEETTEEIGNDEDSTIIIPATPEKGAYIDKEYQNVTPLEFYSACNKLCRENGVELSNFGIDFSSFSSSGEVNYKDDINEFWYTHKQYNTFVHYAGRCCIVMEWKDGNGRLHYNEIKEKKESEEQEMNETKTTFVHVPETEEERARRMEMMAAGMKAGLNARYGKEAQATWQERFEERHGEQLETLINEIDAGAQVAQLESEQPTIKEYLDAAKELQDMAAQADTEEEGESYMITAQQLIECAQALAAPQAPQEEAPQVDFEPAKAVLRWYSDYNGRRYGTPWVGIYDNGDYCFIGVGAFIGNCDKGGALIVNEPRKGVVYAYGQKDHRGNNTERCFALWNGHCFVAATRAGYESKEPLYSSPISYVKDDIVQYVRQIVEG